MMMDTGPAHQAILSLEKIYKNLSFQASFVHQTCLMSKNLRDCQMCCLAQVSPDS